MIKKYTITNKGLFRCSSKTIKEYFFSICPNLVDLDQIGGNRFELWVME